MKKLLCAVAVFGLMLSAASAYNPPVYGDDIFELSSPRQLANASSVVGGGLFYASPESIIVRLGKRQIAKTVYSGVFTDITLGNFKEQRFVSGKQRECQCGIL